MPICHPDLAPQILKPEDLLRHPLLYHLEQPDDWRIWLRRRAACNPSVDSGFSTVAGIIDAVADNFGVGIVPRRLLDADLKTQRVALPFPHPVPSHGGYYFCMRSRGDDPVLDAFRNGCNAARSRI